MQWVNTNKKVVTISLSGPRTIWGYIRLGCPGGREEHTLTIRARVEPLIALILVPPGDFSIRHVRAPFPRVMIGLVVCKAGDPSVGPKMRALI